MATILLNVKLNQNDFKQAEKQINGLFNPTSIVSSKGSTKSAVTNVDNLRKSYSNLLSQLKTLESQYPKGTFDHIKTQTKAMNAAVKNLCNSYRVNGELTEREVDLSKQLSEVFKRLSADTAQLRAETTKLQKENKIAIPNVDNLRKKYANLLNTIQGTEKYYKKGTFSNIANEAKKYLNELRNLDPASSNYADDVNRLDKALGQLSAQFAETKVGADNMHGSLLEIVKGFMKFQAAAMLVMKPLQLLRNAWDDINETLVETENRVVELRRVAGQVANSDELYSLAQRYGQTFENVSEITLNFARNGMEWAEALQATEAALLAINVAELDASQASEGMIAVMNQFGVEASELEEIVDKLNITADNAAVTTEKLLLALQRTGSSAKNAKLDLQETVGIITALSEATGRSGENLGTAVNSLIQFSTKSSSLETFEKLGGDVQKTVEAYRQGGATVLDIWTELSKVIKQNQGLSESVLGKDFSTSDFESLNEELKESLGAAFAETTEIYDTASTFRKNYFIALLQNLDQVQETLDTMNSAQGYSQQENLQYLDTYTAKVNSLEAKWKEIANDEQGLLAIKKIFADLGIGALEVLDYAGGLRTVFVGLAIATLPTVIGLLGKALTTLKAISGVAKGVNASFGWLSLAGVVISAGIGLFQKYNKEQEQTRQLAISNWEANYKNAEVLEDLYDKYKDLSKEDSNYLTVQKDLVEALGEKATALQGLAADSEEYANAVKKMTEAELENYRVKLRAAAGASKDELGSFWFYDDLNYSGSTREMLSARELGLGSNPLERYEEISKIVNSANEEYNRLIREGKFEEANKIIEGKDPRYMYYTADVRALEKGKGVVNSYLQSNTAKLLQDYEISTGSKVTTNNDFDSALDFIVKQLGISDFYKEDIKSALSSLVSLENPKIEAPSGGDTNLESIVDNLKAIRDNTDKAKELEEKQVALANAQLALEEAKNARTVRVFNAQTGQFEMRSNERAIASANENLSNAKDALKNTALDNVLEVLESGELPEDYQIPEWLQNLFAPTDEEKFDRFLTSMGILSGVFNKTATPQSRGAVYNNGGNTTNNNQSYSLNGIPIPAQDAGRYFTPEALELLNQMG